MIRFAAALCLLLCAFPAAAQRPLPGGAEFAQGAMVLRVTALTPSILRVQLAPQGKFPEDASWAVPAIVRAKRAAVTPLADGFATEALTVQVDPATLRLTVTDKAGKTIAADAANPLELRGASFTLRKALPVGEHYFALGDKTGPFDRRGASYVNWTIDAWGYDGTTDPLYKSIPFTLSVGGAGGAYGIFLDNSWRSWFDFGHREDGVLAIGAAGGAVDYYLIAGPAPADVVRRYTDLTGKPPLPPRWALGYQQSRYSYMSDAEVRDIAASARNAGVPLDVLWLDIDFQDRNRPFTTNGAAFPDMKKLAGDLRAAGIRLVAITDLHIAAAPNQGYAPYESGRAGDHFLRNPDGGTYVAPVWPGPAVFPDFTRAATRAWWGTLYKDLVADGVAGFWNDMNEPAIFETPSKTMPLDTVHRIDSDDFAPREASHAEVHNVYGMENARATHEGLLKLQPNTRPFVMTRAAYAGAQRYAVTWTGDNSSSPEHLRLSVQQLLNLGLSGMAWSGADVGGFIGGASPELLTRWIAIGAFTPVFRVHVAKDGPRTEPWADGPEHLAIRRKFIEARYRLLPYLYALAEENSRTGDPVMRPVWYDYPAQIAPACDQSMSFTLGRDLLVAAPPHYENGRPYDICLPTQGWYDYWSGLPVPAAKFKQVPALDRLPVFVRPGTILPRQPLVQSTAEVPQGPLELHVYPGADCRGSLYWDDGASIRGASLRQEIACMVTPQGITLDFGKRKGAYKPWWKEIAVTIHGWDGEGSVKATTVTRDAAARTLSFTLQDQPSAKRISIAR